VLQLAIRRLNGDIRRRRFDVFVDRRTVDYVSVGVVVDGGARRQFGVAQFRENLRHFCRWMMCQSLWRCSTKMSETKTIEENDKNKGGGLDWVQKGQWSVP
jgi:hypothetical protein